MPCNMESYEAMAAEGWTDDEIELLKKEIELARRIAEREAKMNRRTTLAQQTAYMDQAEFNARVVGHDRHHRKQAAEDKEFMDSIANVRPDMVHAHVGHPAKPVPGAQKVFDLLKEVDK